MPSTRMSEGSGAKPGMIGLMVVAMLAVLSVAPDHKKQECYRTIDLSTTVLCGR